VFAQVRTPITVIIIGGSALYGGTDSPRPSARTRILPDEPDGPRLEAGRSARA
jgi:hypothetical protein